MEPPKPGTNNRPNDAPHGAGEPKHANGALGQDRRWLRSVVANSSEVVTVVAPEGTLRYASPAFQKVLGHDPDEAVGKMNVLDLVHPDDLPHVLEETEEALSRGGVVTNEAEYRFRHKDGSWRWMQSSGTYLLGDPDVGGVVVVSRDVTERKRAEEALRESERRLSSVISSAHAFAYRCLNEPGWPNEYASAYARELTGHPPEDLLVGGKISFGDLIVEGDRARVWEEVQRALAEGRSFELTYALRREDGQIRHVHEYGEGVRDEDGKIVALEGLVYDVTERREAAEVLRKSEARLAEAQRLAHLGGWEWDIRTDEISWSDEVYRIYGLAPRSFVPSFERFMEVVHPDDKVLISGAIGGALTSCKPYELEHRIVRPDGEVRWVHRRAEVVRGEGGEPLRMIGTVHDITEREETARALKESEERYRRQSRDLLLLHRARTALARELDIGSVLRGVVEVIAETYGYTQVSAYLLEEEELVLQHQVGYREVIERIHVTEGVSGRTIRTGQPVLI